MNENPRGEPHAAQLATIGLPAGGGLGVNQIRDGRKRALQRALRLRHRRLELGDLALEPPSLGGMRLALRGIQLALARGLVLVAQTVGLAEPGLRRGELLLRADRSVDVRVDAAAPAALDDLVAPAGEASGIEHGGNREAHRPAPGQAAWRRSRAPLCG